jgi:hypothetical protein
MGVLILPPEPNYVILPLTERGDVSSAAAFGGRTRVATEGDFTSEVLCRQLFTTKHFRGSRVLYGPQNTHRRTRTVEHAGRLSLAGVRPRQTGLVLRRLAWDRRRRVPFEFG